MKYLFTVTLMKKVRPAGNGLGMELHIVTSQPQRGADEVLRLTLPELTKTSTKDQLRQWLSGWLAAGARLDYEDGVRVGPTLTLDEGRLPSGIFDYLAQINIDSVDDLDAVAP